jgi:Ni,Fe-hydrogenase I cytochrome b subunit
MNTIALVFMVTTLSIVTLVTGYFFYKAYTTPEKEEEKTEV